LDIDSVLADRYNRSEILLIGGSAGSFKLIFQVVKDLPAYTGKAVIIVIHRKRNFLSKIEKLFAGHSHILLREISDKDKINKNVIYIAPANYHALIEKEGCFALDVSEAVWFSRPSIDVTFESAAEVYGDKCTAVLLSGANPDGAAGMLRLKQAGALTIVQDPADAQMPEMPQAALNLNAADYVLRANEIFELLKSSPE
jgi:two-component system chemotaxis response regulator CheB